MATSAKTSLSRGPSAIARSNIAPAPPSPSAASAPKGRRRNKARGKTPSKKRKIGTAAAAAAGRLLNEGTTLYVGAAAAGIDLDALRELHLLTTKPFLYVFNVDEEELANAAREEAAAIASYNIAIQRLERAKGTLLKYNNVKIGEDQSESYLRRTWAAYETDPARGVR